MVFLELIQLLSFVVVALLALGAMGAFVVLRKKQGKHNESQWHPILIGMIVGVIVIFVGVTFWVSSQPEPGTPIPRSQLETPALQRAITTYLETKVQPGNAGEKAFCAYRLLGGSQRKEGAFVYLWSLCGGFVKGKAAASSGGSYPLALQVSLASSRVLAHQRPEDGSRYLPSIKRIFPRRYHKRIFAGSAVYNRRARTLIKITQHRAKAYFAGRK